jgi:hypothetical protein
MRRKDIRYLVSAVLVIVLVHGFGSATLAKPSVQNAGKSYKDYPDNTFNVREYIQGMTKGARNVLIWQDPAADLKKYRSVKVTDFGGQLLPVQNVFSYDPFVSSFNATFQSSLKLPKEEASDALRIEGAVVECNPGSRAARAWVGFGAGRAAGAVVCEIYEPGASQPCMRIYVRDTGSSGGSWGGNSLGMLNHIFYTVANRLSTFLEVRIGR